MAFGLALAFLACWLGASADSVPDPIHAGKRASEWLGQLDCGDLRREHEATNAFMALGTNALPVLKAALAHRDSSLRRLLIDVQCQFPGLGLDFVSSSARSRHTEALSAAAILNTDARPILPELAEAVGECGAFSHVEFLAGFNTIAVKPVTAALNNTGNIYGARALLEALSLILASNRLSSAEEELVIAAGTDVLRSDWDEFVDREAAYAVGKFGPNAERVIPVLLDCLTNREPKSSYSAASALGKIGRQPEVVLPALVQATDKRRFNTVRAEAARAMGDFGADATPWMPLLFKLTADRDREVRDGAMHALIKIDPEARQTISALKRQLRDSHPYSRRRAAEFSRAVTMNSRRISPALRKLLEDKDEQVRREAAATLADYSARGVVSRAVTAPRRRTSLQLAGGPSRCPSSEFSR